MILLLVGSVSSGANAGWSKWEAFGHIQGHRELVPAAVGQNQDGRLEVFEVDVNGNLWHVWQNSPNGNWHMARNLGKPSGKTLSHSVHVGQNQNGSLAVFVVDAGGTVWNRQQTSPNGSLGNWQDLGKPRNPKYTSINKGDVPVGNIAVGQNQNGRLELIALGSDKNLWRKYQTDPNKGWSHEWEIFGKKPSGVRLESDTRLAVARNRDGRMEVFVRGYEIPASDTKVEPDIEQSGSSLGKIWHFSQTEPNKGWSDWRLFGRPSDNIVPSDVWVGHNADGRIDVFATCYDYSIGRYSLWHKWQITPSNAWTGWDKIGNLNELDGGYGSVAVGQWGNGRLEIFALGRNNEIWHTYQTAPNKSWASWRELTREQLPSDSKLSNPAVGLNEDGRMEVFIHAVQRTHAPPDAELRTLYHIWWEWSP